MFTGKCGFCGRGNPAAAKYCNECAAPLHLWPCKQCDAVNERSMANCHQCGAVLVVEDIEDDPLESLPFESELDFGPSTIGGNVHHRTGEDPGDVQKITRHGSRGARSVVEILAHKTPTGAWVTPSFFPPQHAAQMTPMQASETRQPRRRAMPFGLAAFSIATAAVALYVFNGQSTTDRVSTGADSAASADANRMAAQPAARAQKNEALLATPTAAVVASPVTEGRIRIVDDSGTDKEGGAQGGASTASAAPSPGAASAQPALAHAVDQAIEHANPVKTKAFDRVASTSARRPVAASSATGSASAFPDADALVVRRPAGGRDDTSANERERQRSCTDSIAALGLCNARAEGRSP